MEILGSIYTEVSEKFQNGILKGEISRCIKAEKHDLGVVMAEVKQIGNIAEELWIYSKSVELLTEPEDACYLAAQTQDIQLNITEMLCLLKNKLPFKDVDWLIEICDNVFSGEKFDDIMFNNVIEHFIQKKIEQ